MLTQVDLIGGGTPLRFMYEGVECFGVVETETASGDAVIVRGLDGAYIQVEKDWIIDGRRENPAV